MFLWVNRILDEMRGTHADLAPTAPAPNACAQGITGYYRTVGMAPDQMRFVERWTRFPIECEAGNLQMRLPGHCAFRLSPTAEALAFAMEGGQGEGEGLRFRIGDDGRLNGYARMLHIERVRGYERTSVVAGLIVGGWLLFGVGARVGIRARWRR